MRLFYVNEYNGSCCERGLSCLCDDSAETQQRQGISRPPEVLSPAKERSRTMDG
jgi:hypothetical protein